MEKTCTSNLEKNQHKRKTGLAPPDTTWEQASRSRIAPSALYRYMIHATRLRSRNGEYLHVQSTTTSCLFQGRFPTQLLSATCILLTGGWMGTSFSHREEPLFLFVLLFGANRVLNFTMERCSATWCVGYLAKVLMGSGFLVFFSHADRQLGVTLEVAVAHKERGCHCWSWLKIVLRACLRRLLWSKVTGEKRVCTWQWKLHECVDLSCHPYTYFTCGVSFA